mgnify:CR=1 FL=1
MGIVAVAALVFFFYGFNYLKGEPIFSSARKYYAVYPTISGLSVDNNVVYLGLKVGKVTHAELLEDNTGTLVEFIITDDRVNIPAKSTAIISSPELIGSKVITLVYSKATEVAQDGDTLVGEVEQDLSDVVDARLKPLESKTKELISSIDSVVATVQLILDKDARKNLTESFESINASFAAFEITSLRIDSMIANEKQRVEQIMAHVESITKNVRDNNEELNRIIDNFAMISDSVAKADLVGTIQNAEVVLGEVSTLLDRVNRGEGSLGALVTNDSLYYHLENSALELDKLLEDIRVNPERYVHLSVIGRKEKAKDKPKKRDR